MKNSDLKTRLAHSPFKQAVIYQANKINKSDIRRNFASLTKGLRVDCLAVLNSAKIKIDACALAGILNRRRRIRVGRHRRPLPWLDRRHNGVWYVFWYDEKARQTRRRSLGTTEKTLAESAYSQFLLRWNGTSSRLKEVLEFYFVTHVDQYAASQRQRYAFKPLTRHFGNCKIVSIDVPACHAYANARRAENVGDSTIRRELSVVQAAANFSRKHKRISESQMPVIELPPAAPPRQKFLSHGELQTIIDKADPVLHNFIALLYFTGARRKSIEDLTVMQVDLVHGNIHLMPPNASPNQIRSKKHKPTIPAVPEILDLLEKLIRDKLPDERILPKRNYYLMFKQHLRQLGLPSKSYPHILRHTRATHLLQAGTPIYSVARLLGDSIVTVEKTYGHHATSDLAKSLRGPVPRLNGLD